MRLLIIIFMMTLHLIGNPIILTDTANISSCEKYNKLNKYDYLTQLVESSNFDFNRWGVKAKNTNLLIDEDNGTNIVVQLYIENKGSVKEKVGLSGIGWLEYSLKNRKLFDITNGLEELNFDVSWNDVLATESLPIKKYVLIKEKTFLYLNSNTLKKTNKFLIKNDCALVLNDEKKDWIEIYFYHKKWKTHTILWLHIKGMET